MLWLLLLAAAFVESARIMAEPEAVGVVFACGPGICDMDVSTLQGEAPRIFVGGGEGMLKVRVGHRGCRACRYGYRLARVLVCLKRKFEMHCDTIPYCFSASV